ncbi:hypothetical protein PMZ80_009099 [Knufia obscura]|uniref:NAD(P)-binding protein n=1 Tax=Knufia obscura TaxID=1635080 RepID=A0ABR0RE51_9EURO|nr:hypothetical protein PMZ80_009099 [Knufia obscura]
MANTSRVILLTGASRGVGYAIAKFLINAPAQNKVILASRTPGPLEELKKIAPERVDYSAGDLCDPTFINKAVELAVTKFGRLDALILNHGTLGQVRRIADLEMQDWQDCFQTNFFSCAIAAKYAIPELRKTNGRIIITSSGAASNGYTTWGIYGATKAAQNHLALTLKAEEPDITTVAIRPGMVDTDMQKAIREEHKDKMDPEDMKKFIGAFEEGKLVKPEQCGHVIAELALSATPDLSGKFMAWNDETLAAYQLK